MREQQEALGKADSFLQQFSSVTREEGAERGDDAHFPGSEYPRTLQTGISQDGVQEQRLPTSTFTS